MPDSAGEWAWWIFTTVILASLVNFGTNLLSPKIDRYLGRWSAQRRARSLSRDKAESQYVAKMIKLIESDPRVFWMVTHEASEYMSWGRYYLILACLCLAVIGVAMVASGDLFAVLTLIGIMFPLFFMAVRAALQSFEQATPYNYILESGYMVVFDGERFLHDEQDIDEQSNTHQPS